MDNFWIIATCGLIVVTGLFGAYNVGKQEIKAEIDAQGLTTYIEVMEALKNESVDLSNNNAVTAELCRLAGLPTDAPECGDM